MKQDVRRLHLESQVDKISENPMQMGKGYQPMIYNVKKAEISQKK